MYNTRNTLAPNVSVTLTWGENEPFGLTPVFFTNKFVLDHIFGGE
jgi:hypothetical protein